MLQLTFTAKNLWEKGLNTETFKVKTLFIKVKTNTHTTGGNQYYENDKPNSTVKRHQRGVFSPLIIDKNSQV